MSLPSSKSRCSSSTTSSKTRCRRSFNALHTFLLVVCMFPKISESVVSFSSFTPWPSHADEEPELSGQDEDTLVVENVEWFGGIVILDSHGDEDIQGQDGRDGTPELVEDPADDASSSVLSFSSFTVLPHDTHEEEVPQMEEGEPGGWFGDGGIPVVILPEEKVEGQQDGGDDKDTTETTPEGKHDPGGGEEEVPVVTVGSLRRRKERKQSHPEGRLSWRATERNGGSTTGALSRRPGGAGNRPPWEP